LTNRLAEIFDHKRQEVAESKLRLPLTAVRVEAAYAEPPRGFLAALKAANRPLALIAEVKKASPSMGMIRDVLDAPAIAAEYERAGAHAISVLTDEKYFLGSAKNLVDVKSATSLPCLRKDFIEDPYQVFEARAWGADAILLILAFLENSLARDLLALSTGLGMDTLVEVHSMKEAERAMGLEADLIGVNNRSLLDFQTDLRVGEEILPQIDNAFKVAESALCGSADVSRMCAAGANGVLIGTAFCSQPVIADAVRKVMGW
jgi:indole-3-glycerol phosphate synthase